MAKGMRNSGIPLGGLGTGSVEIRQDGCFHEWQIMNNKPWGTGKEIQAPRNTGHFGMCVSTPEGPRSFLLGMPGETDDWMNNPYDLPWLSHPERIEASARFPFTKLEYEFDDSPIQVAMEAFSPFIPHDANNSGLPLAYMTFTLANRTEHTMKVSVFQAMRNLTGYDREELASVMAFRTNDNRSSITYEREWKERGSLSSFGSLTLSTFSSKTGEASYALHPRGSRDIWEPLRENGTLENVDYGDYTGMLGNEGDASEAMLRSGIPFGVLCRSLTLDPGEEARVVFMLAWHFPCLLEKAYGPKGKPEANIGHRYEQWFQHAEEVAGYGVIHYEALRERTRAFVDAFYSSSLPEWKLDAIYAQMTTLVKSSWWDRCGRFGIWEGLGRCGLQTTDITYYGSFPIAQLFPEIQKSQMRLTVDNIDTPGEIPHLMPANFSCCEVDHRKRIDLVPQFILLVWRDYLWTDDIAYARDIWPQVMEALAAYQSKDLDGDGLPNHTGPDQTYDQFPFRGTSSFVGFLYAAALQAAAQLAAVLEDEASQSLYSSWYEAAIHKLDEQLWTGTYYRLCFDSATGYSNEGIMADQINADWFVRQSTGQGLIPEEKVLSALREVIRSCRKPEGYIANCVWPTGEGIRIGRHTANQADWPWSGVEFALAAHCLAAGMEQEGWNMVREVWERYERAGLRFSHIECGDHYYRALSSWSVYLMWSGFSCDEPMRKITLDVSEPEKRMVIARHEGWGLLTRRGRAIEMEVRDGRQRLKRLELKGLPEGAELSCRLDGEAVACTVEYGGTLCRITFDEELVCHSGSVLRIVLES